MKKGAPGVRKPFFNHNALEAYERFKKTTA